MSCMKRLIFIFACSLAIALPAADVVKPRRLAAAAAASADGTGGVERVLTDEQRKQLRDFVEEQAPDFRENVQKLAQLRLELQEAALNGKADEKLIREKTDAVAKLDAEQLRARTLALAKIAPTLTKEQRKKIEKFGERMRAGRPELGAGQRGAKAAAKRDPAAPPPPEK